MQGKRSVLSSPGQDCSEQDSVLVVEDLCRVSVVSPTLSRAGLLCTVPTVFSPVFSRAGRLFTGQCPDVGGPMQGVSILFCPL